MAAPTTNQNSQNLASIKIVYPRYVRQVLPAINLGEIMPIFVRRAPQQGSTAGLINIKGMVVNAELPRGLNRESVSMLRLPRLVIRLFLSWLTLLSSTELKQLTHLKRLRARFKACCNNLSSSAMRTPSPFSLSPAEAPLEANVLEALKELAKAPSSIPSMADLVDPKTAFAQLLASAGGDLIVDLKETAKELQKTGSAIQPNSGPANRSQYSPRDRTAA